MRIGNKQFSNRDVTIACCSMGLAGCAIWAAIIMAGQDMQLYMLDGDYKDKCYSMGEDDRFNASAAERSARDIISMTGRFRTAGAEYARELVNENYTLCQDIDDESVQPTAHWERLRILFTQSSYPRELAASEFFEPARNAYWDARLREPASLNRYTPEAGLAFSRISRAVKVATELSDILEATGQAYRSADQEPWRTYIAENPELEGAVRAFTASYKGTIMYDDSMRLAIDAYLGDERAVHAGDLAYLQAYLPHVSILNDNSYEPIYRQGWQEYAIIDADRDGLEDDLIRLDRRNRGIEYFYDYEPSAFSLRRKTETRTENYSCGTTEQPQTCTRTVTENVSERVYFEVIPAATTATIDLSPQTVAEIARFSTMRLYDSQSAQALLDSPDTLTLYSADTQELMASIRQQMRLNMPEREHSPSAPNYGLLAPER